ncbi:DNA repair exonuclease [Bacillus sp. HMF5848]|uniref:metallophosphoesterase family protein n=1 Tax=Bacillus sp. HMF5848 TaxID=2495421 RepID=UPI000F7B26F0|nr:DNA repair exonuclease [Bacillus sp. HMF5848]RSK26316.1 DNA repair exonuclease [Bacillus sp. HMF5848]
MTSPITFIHMADLHLDSPFIGLSKLPEPIFHRLQESTFKSLTRIITHAINRKVDFVIIAGDIFDGERRSLRAQLRFRAEMERLQTHNIPAYIIHGNHDHLGGVWIDIDWPENVHIFPDKVTCIPFEKDQNPVAHLYGFSYPSKAVHENMLSHYKKVPGPEYHIGLLHGSEEGNTNHSRYASFSVKELLEADMDYWALGHIHVRQQLGQKSIFYPGNIQGLHRKEIGEKGCLHVELSQIETKTTFIPTSELIWKSYSINIENYQSFDEILSALYTVKEEIREGEAGVLATLEIVGKSEWNYDLRQPHVIEEVLLNLQEGEEERQNFVWVVDCKLHTQPNVSLDSISYESTFFKTLYDVMEQPDDDDTIMHVLLRDSTARAFLQPKLEEEWAYIQDEAKQLLLSELTQMLIKEGGGKA